MPDLYKPISVGKVDIITHVLPLDQVKRGYEIVDTTQDDCIKGTISMHQLKKHRNGINHFCAFLF